MMIIDEDSRYNILLKIINIIFTFMKNINSNKMKKINKFKIFNYKL